jgi:dihydrodipicolinate synthase/N-acetylneuraminate lyase
VPLVTPFRNEVLDLDPLRDLVEWLLGCGIRGFLALGTTGEAAHLTEGEAHHVLGAVVRAAAGRAPVLAGAGRPSTIATIAACERAAATGADGVLVLTPHAYRARMDRDALVQHYTRVADAAPVPVFVYHMPEVSGVDLDPGVLAELVSHPNVWGFKDSSTDGGPLAATLERARTCGFAGSGARFLEGLRAGAAGGILAVAHAAPEAAVALHEAWRAGDLDRARARQVELAEFAAALRGWAVPGLKHALALRGLPAGDPRSPLLAPPHDVRARIAAALRRLLPESDAARPS